MPKPSTALANQLHAANAEDKANPDNRPNVLLVCTDHWFGDLFGHRGHPIIQTPGLDQLAGAGTVFTNMHAECPVCGPARRALMTGTSPAANGDRTFESYPIQGPTLAQCLRDVGYQTNAVGKLHVNPQRARLGFDEVLLSEEGRIQDGVVDDYEYFLAQEGYAGQYMAHGMSNNQYHFAPWHLPDHCHPTNWATQQMCRQIQRRDPSKPGFWYLSYVHPHPPLTPLKQYMDLYKDIEIPEPAYGDWSRDAKDVPHNLWAERMLGDRHYNGKRAYQLAVQAFYALCTHIDHQLRVVIGTLQEEGLLKNTIICFTSDHGDMLGQHGTWAKRLFYRRSTHVPLYLLGTGCARIKRLHEDNRLCGHQDIMPTILDLCEVPVPTSCTGQSLVTEQKRDYFFGEFGNEARATRMITDGQYKLIYYATGNVFQLFDTINDPNECDNLVDQEAFADKQSELTAELINHMHDDDSFLQNGKLIGLPDKKRENWPDSPGLGSQRGIHFPLPPGTLK